MNKERAIEIMEAIKQGAATLSIAEGMQFIGFMIAYSKDILGGSPTEWAPDVRMIGRKGGTIIMEKETLGGDEFYGNPGETVYKVTFEA